MVVSDCTHKTPYVPLCGVYKYGLLKVSFTGTTVVHCCEHHQVSGCKSFRCFAVCPGLVKASLSTVMNVAPKFCMHIMNCWLVELNRFRFVSDSWMLSTRTRSRRSTAAQSPLKRYWNMQLWVEKRVLRRRLLGAKWIVFSQMENIEVFLKACKNWGMKEVDTFQTQDLYDMKALYSVRQLL